jgi:predicted HD phosphohydrolase
MLCDWKAAALRHHNGNILKSIEHNAKRFSIDSQLVRIFKNTIELFEDI